MTGVRIPAMAEIFSLSRLVQIGSGAHPTSYQTVTGVFSLVLNRPVREADRSPPFSVELKNGWSYTSILPYVFMA